MDEKRHIAEEVGDALAGLLTLGVLVDLVPVILGIFGILWFSLRFVNFFRVNVLQKQPWKFY